MTITEECKTAAQRFRATDSTERRQFVRIRLEAEIRYAKTGPAECEHNPRWTAGLLRDISGGGARLTTSEKLDLKDKVVLELPIEDKLICLHGSVQHVQSAKSQDLKQFEVGIQFLDIDEIQRNKIVGLVFRLQLNMGRQSQPSVR